jgi:transposase
MTMPRDDVTPRIETRRIEVFTGSGPRRRWSAEDKALIVAESYSGVGTVCDVARRHGLAPTQLFTWRREARKALPAPESMFAPVVIESEPAQLKKTPVKRVRRRSRWGDGVIELEIDGVTMRVERGADAKTVAAVIRALKVER